MNDHDNSIPQDEPVFCPRCGAPDGGTTCGLPNCGLMVGYEEDDEE